MKSESKKAEKNSNIGNVEDSENSEKTRRNNNVSQENTVSIGGVNEENSMSDCDKRDNSKSVGVDVGIGVPETLSDQNNDDKNMSEKNASEEKVGERKMGENNCVDGIKITQQLREKLDDKPVTCDELIEHLFEYVDNELSGNMCDRLKTHIEKCGYCKDCSEAELHVRQILKQKCCDKAPKSLKE